MATLQGRDQLVSPQQLADLLGVSLSSVYSWRYEGKGPRGYRVEARQIPALGGRGLACRLRRCSTEGALVTKSGSQKTSTVTPPWRAVPCYVFGERLLTLGHTAALVHLYFIASKHANSEGLSQIPSGYVATDLSMSIEDVERVLRDLE